jgi:hypothetical protein
MQRRKFLQLAAASPLAYWPELDGMISTGDETVDQAAKLAIRALKRNVSEKWGKLCPIAGPPWERHYPAWIHPFDNFWMTRITPYLYPREQAEWPTILFQRYQRPTGMIGWGIHDTAGPEEFLAELERSGKVREESANSRYIRDHLYIHQVHDLWWFYGDTDWVRRMLPSCRKALDYLYSMKDLDGDGLVESASILEDVDVGSTAERTGPNAAERAVDQVILYGALLAYARMAEAIGQAGEAERTRARDLAEKVNRLFWHPKGYYRFAIDSRTHQPLPIESTSTYANGYALLYGMVPAERVNPMLDFLTSWDFEVPGPVILPPIEGRTSVPGKDVDLPRGVYANGGCGWGRGHMPSVCLALFRHGRPEIARTYIRKHAAAAVRDGAFYEYWTWEKYTGKTKPGGCQDYSETSSAFLDAVIHGAFGVTAVEAGWKRVRVAPQPLTEKPASLRLALPGGALRLALAQQNGRWSADLESGAARQVELVLPDTAARRLELKPGVPVRV